MFGHDYKITRHVTYHVKEYTCKNCGKQLTTNSNGKLTELTPKFREINDVLERIHLKRKKRIAARNSTPQFENLLVFSH